MMLIHNANVMQASIEMINAYIIFSILTGITIPACPQDIQPTVIILAPDGGLVEVPTQPPECNAPDDGIEEA